MTAQSHHFTTPHFSQRYADNALAIAKSVYSGCASMLPAVEVEHFSFDDWQECATDAVEFGTVDRFRDMLAEEQAHSDFVEGQRAGRIHEYADFDEWLAGNRNCYWFTDTAQSAAKWDDMFATINAGHHAFVRGGL